MELKDDVDTGVLGDYVPLAGHYDEVEATIWRSLSPRGFSPRRVRGGHETGGPRGRRVADTRVARGRLVFVFLEDGAHRGAYLGGARIGGQAALRRLRRPFSGFAGFFKINNAQGDFDLVQERVSAGFIVTSNVDDVDGTQEERGQAGRIPESRLTSCRPTIRRSRRMAPTMARFGRRAGAMQSSDSPRRMHGQRPRTPQ